MAKTDNNFELAEKIRKNWQLAKVIHTKWVEKIKEAYKYYEGKQAPDLLPSGIKVYAQINRIAETHDVQLGILSTSKPQIQVVGCGEDENDLDRINLIQRLMKWIIEYIALGDELIGVYSDFILCGLGTCRVRYDPFRFSSTNLGFPVVERIPPFNIILDPQCQKPDGTDARFIIYETSLNKEQFFDQFSLLFSNNPNLDLERIWDSAHKINGIDSTSKDKITVLEYEYVRIVNKELINPVTSEPVIKDGKKIVLPVKEYRVAIYAGDTILSDTVSELNNLQMWRKVLFPNFHSTEYAPYSIGYFEREKPIQDLINVLLSLTINQQAKNLTGPWQFLKGSVDDPYKWVDDADNGRPLVFDYTEDMQAMGIPPQLAVPQKMIPPSVDYSVFRILDWLFNVYETVSVKDVIRGEAPRNIRSGYGIRLLQTFGMQPNYLLKARITKPLSYVGKALWEIVRNKLAYNVEIPISLTSQEYSNTIINRIVLPEEIKEYVQQENVEKLKMISVRFKDKKISFKKFVEQYSDLFASIIENGNALKDIDFIENDIQFGNYEVSIVIDPLEEQNREDRINRIQIFMPLMARLNPVVALKWGLKAMGEPQTDELINELTAQIKENIAQNVPVPKIEEQEQRPEASDIITGEQATNIENVMNEEKEEI